MGLFIDMRLRCSRRDRRALFESSEEEPAAMMSAGRCADGLNKVGSIVFCVEIETERVGKVSGSKLAESPVEIKL